MTNYRVESSSGRAARKMRLALMGPAFIAAIGYIDPGNFATNIQAGASFGYQLLWVVVWANLMAMLIQILSAKLGIATGKNLAELIRASGRLGAHPRFIQGRQQHPREDRDDRNHHEKFDQSKILFPVPISLIAVHLRTLPSESIKTCPFSKCSSSSGLLCSPPTKMSP